MTFQELNNKFLTLRSRLAGIDPKIKLDEIGVEIPKSDNDELSFLRLILWGYVFINENAKIHLRFFKEITEEDFSIPYINVLRTYMAHNLSLAKDNDLITRSKAHRWFLDVCSNASPDTENEWKQCFNKIVEDLFGLVSDTINNCTLLESEPDGSDNLEQLIKRIEKNWDGYRFDEYVRNAKINLGYDSIDTVSFRNTHLEKWRKVVKVTSVGENIDDLLQKRVEADLIKYMSSSLPYTSKELSEKFNLDQATSLQTLVILLQNNINDGSSLKEVIDQAAQHFSTNN